MNSTQHIHRPANGMKRLMKWPLLCGLLTLVLSQLTWAASDLYENDAVINYPNNVPNPPVVDATNFVNTGTFIINFTAFSVSRPFYETSDTLNYTNTGLMMANTGFQFDNQPSSDGVHTWSGNFFNSGSISCGSTNNVGYINIGGLFYYSLTYAQCLVHATNIVNPGKIDAGYDGLIQLTGNNLDLTHGVLSVEGASANLAGSGIKDLNTNYWDPSIYLGPTTAESAFIPIAPYYLYLTNSTAYIQQDAVGTNTVITRAVFIQDTSGSGVSNNVYFPPLSLGGQDYAVIEWAGAYLNPSDNSVANNYLYLFDNYVEGSDTNLIYNNGIPYNFTITESGTRIPLGAAPASAGFYNVFPAGGITNIYSFANAQLISTTISTNDIPNHSVTNLPGRIELSSSDDLNLAAARIAGPNYLLLKSPEQFDGSPGASIQSPYSDINLGVTNGFLTVSNLISPSIPNWSGNIQAWSTRWLEVDSTGVTNDFRVLIVGSELNPLTLAQVQDLILHSTNSLVISDQLNIMRTLNADAQNLTLTTNGPGNGATSLDGELNVESSQVFWKDSLPNLRNLTNNGAIRFQNLAQFIGTSNNVDITPDTPAVAATGTLSEVAGRANVSAGNKVIIQGNQSLQYVFTNSGKFNAPYQVAIANTFDGTMSNLIAAINGSTGVGTVYSAGTLSNADVSAGILSGHAFTITARAAGTNGNKVYTALSTSTTNVVWGGNYLSGGVDFVPGSTNITSSTSVPYDNFINHGWVSDNGSAIWANHFESSGTISNGVGSFNLSALTTTLTNGSIQADGDIVITADSLVTSNVLLKAGRSLTFTVTNLLTDDGVTNGNIWTLRNTNGTGGNGLILPIKPMLGDLLGTTITNYAPSPNQQSINIWAGEDRGVSVIGYTNNAAIGRLILDAAGANSQFVFKGASVSNAIYIDDLEFADAMTNGINRSFDFSDNLSIGTNMMIYFAQATVDGISIAAKIDAASKAGKNGGRLRWIPAYAGYYSSTPLIYPDGTTNLVNTALAGSSSVDSDGDGIPNASDPSPFFVQSQVNLNITLTNIAESAALLRWSSIPGSTNYIYYKTNLNSQVWLTLTNYVSPSTVPPSGGWPITNTVLDTLNQGQEGFYKIKIIPNSTLLYGP